MEAMTDNRSVVRSVERRDSKWVGKKADWTVCLKVAYTVLIRADEMVVR